MLTWPLDISQMYFRFTSINHDSFLKELFCYCISKYFSSTISLKRLTCRVMLLPLSLVLNNTLHKHFVPTKTNITNSQPHWNQNFTLFPNSFSVFSLNIFCYRNIKADLFHSSLKFAQNALKPFLYPLKASERLWITDVFGGE